MSDSLKTTSIFNQAFWLGFGQLCTFALSFVSAAILSRYFDKTEYGTYKQILYVYYTLSSLFTVGLPSVFAYFIPRLNTGQQKTLISAINRLFLLLGAVFSVTLFVLSGPIASLLKNPELAIGLKIFSPFPLFTLPTMGVEGIYTALRKTKTIAIYSVVSKLLMLLCIVLPVVLFHTGYKEAIIGWGLASFATFIFAMVLKNRPYVKVEKELVENMYKMVFNYSIPLMGAFVAGFFISSADQFFVSRYYGTAAFAEFSNGCLSIPFAAMIANSVKNVLLPIFSRADLEGNMDEMTGLYNNAVQKSTTLILPILLFCIFFARAIMVFVYGESYAISGSYIICFLLRDFVSCLPYFSVLMALGKSKIYMNMHIVGAMAIWTLDFLLVFLHLPPQSIVVVSSLFHIACPVYALSYIKHKSGFSLMNKHIIIHMLKIVLHCASCLMFVYYLASLMTDMSVFVQLVVCGMLYYGILFFTGRLIKTNYFESVYMLLHK